jgi:predicted lipoprotein
MFNRRLACLVLAFAAALPLAGCKIVSIADQNAAEPAGFDAAAYADGIWASQVLPHFSESARPVVEVVAAIGSDLAEAGKTFGYRAGEGSPWSFVVSGSGTVAAKNTESRAGTMEVTVEGLADPVVLQIGPVIRGNAVRDALPFVAFKDFTNQIEYANAGKALTVLALAGFEGNVEAIAAGDTVKFTGAISMAGASDKVLVTPVVLERAAP